MARASVMVGVLALVARASASLIEDRLINPLVGGETELLAAALIIVGAAVTFLGSRVYTLMRIVFGFITAFHMGFYSVASFVSSNHTLWAFCIALGVVGGAITFKFQKLAKAAVGLVFGVLVGYMVYVVFVHFLPNAQTTYLYVGIAIGALVGIGLGVKAAVVAVTVMTAFVGAFGVVFGIDMVSEHQLTLSNVENQHLNGAGWVLVATWMVLGVLGSWYQFFSFDACLGSKAVGKSQQAVTPLIANTPLKSLCTAPQAVDGRAGLVNTGNTCFMNSTIQALYAVVPLRHAFLDMPMPPQSTFRFNLDPPLAELVCSVMRQLHSAVFPSLRPAELRVILRKLGFLDGNQHDASEFMREMLNRLMEDAKGQQSNPVKDIFGFETEGVVRCEECGHESVMKEENIDLSLEIPLEEDLVHLTALLNRYFEATILDGDDRYQCDNCCAKTRAKRFARLASLPTSLIVTLNRFRFCKRTMRKLKRMDRVEVPETISVAGVTYELSSLIVHAGASADGGHYYAFSNLAESLGFKHWFEFNDRDVTRTSFAAVNKVCTSMASDGVYVLLFTRVKA